MVKAVVGCCTAAELLLDVELLAPFLVVTELLVELLVELSEEAFVDPVFDSFLLK